MRETQPSVAGYRAGDLEIDLGRQRVMRAGDEVPLPKLSFDLLLTLVRAAPNIVSLDELMAAVWPGVVVSPETVSQRVKLLRDALGDDPRAPRYVAGLRGRGYRLAPPVEVLADLEPRAAQALPTLATPVASRAREWHWVLGLGGAAAIALVGGLYGFRAPPERASAPRAIPTRSVAVLPFESLSPDARDIYLAAGVSEALQDRLAARSDVLVIASTSSVAARERTADLREIGAALGARYLLDGSVQRDGDRLRVTTRMIDARDGGQLWSLRFDRNLGDLFALEDEIADRATDQLSLVVSHGSGERVMPPSGNFEAYLEYLQARALLARFRVPETQIAIEKLERATALAPPYPQALLALAEARIQYAALSDEQGQAAWQEVRDDVERVIALDPKQGEAFVLRGFWETRESELRKGLALAPNFAPGYALLAQLLWEGDRLDEAEEALSAAVRIDPYSARNHHLRGVLLTERGRFDEAESAYRTALHVDPLFHPSITRLATLERWGRGNFALAAKLAENAIAIAPGEPMARIEAIGTYLDMGCVQAARDVVASFPPGRLRAIAAIQIDQFEGKYEEAVREAEAAEALDEDRLALLRDRALQTGNLSEGLRAMERAAPEAQVRSEPFAWQGGPLFNLPRAQLLLASGGREAAERLAREVLAVIDRRSPSEIDAFYRPYRAVAFALMREDERALGELALDASAGFRGGRWYSYEREPALDRIRRDPRFQVILAKRRAHAESERERLEAMRERGEIPRRP